MTWLGNTFPVGGAAVSYGVVLMIVLYLATWFWLRETGAGAVMSTRWATTRKRPGSSASRPTACCSASTCWPGACSTASPRGLAVSRTGVGDPNAGQTENLDAITAVVLGGTSLFGAGA